MLFGGERGGGGWSGEVASAYQVIKELKIDHLCPQPLQNVRKKQRGNSGYWNSEYMYSIEQ